LKTCTWDGIYRIEEEEVFSRRGAESAERWDEPRKALKSRKWEGRAAHWDGSPYQREGIP